MNDKGSVYMVGIDQVGIVGLRLFHRGDRVEHVEVEWNRPDWNCGIETTSLTIFCTLPAHKRLE